MDTTPVASEKSEWTKNRKGRTFHIIGEPERHWVSSLPNSHLPLLDVGACYGVQTMYAMNQGRNVIALDCCDEHITILRERVAKMDRTDATGQLQDVITAQLPASDAIGDESVSGILCSEVIHFMTPPDLRPLFKDFYRWVAPRGKVVVTTGSWPPRLKWMLEKGCTLADGIAFEDAYDMLTNKAASEVFDAGPGMMKLPPLESVRTAFGDHVYMLSTEELRHVSESSGFIVEEVRYYSGGKYADEDSEDKPETVVLVASKAGIRKLGK